VQIKWKKKEKRPTREKLLANCPKKSNAKENGEVPRRGVQESKREVSRPGNAREGNAYFGTAT